jgi:hypothetical protein
MADNHHEEDQQSTHHLSRQATREWEANDPVVAANSLAQDEPSSDPSSPIARSTGDDSDSLEDPEKQKALGDEKAGNGDTIVPIDTNAESQLERLSTRQSMGWNPNSESMKPPDVKQTFWIWINPLKWNPPPVPTERTIPSKEYTANWFSRLTFHWMQSIMTVRIQHSKNLANECRLGINVHFNSTTSGL